MLVTALVLQRDGKTSHPVETYMRCLGQLVATGLPITVFCDRALVPSLPERPNLTVVPVTFAELPLAKKLNEQHVRLPKGRNPEKDTFDYLVIQNSKTHFVNEAIDQNPTVARFSWIDAGITHYMADPDNTLKRLSQISKSPLGRVSLPGCSGWATAPSPDYVNWFFCGSFFTGLRSALRFFHRDCQNVIMNLLPVLTWEVNVWAEVARRDPGAFHRYLADHDDSILADN